MLTHRSEYYIRKDFGFIDLGLNGLIDRTTRDVYEVLRRFVWRSEDTGHPEMRALCREGFLCARISQATLGAYTQLGRQQVNTHIASLRRLGWIKVVSFVDKNVGTKAYVLGETVRDSVGRTHETFYADGMLCDLWDAVATKAKLARGPEATPLTAFTIEERVALVTAQLQQIAAPSTEDDELPPCLVNATGGVVSGRQGVSGKRDRGCLVDSTLEEDAKSPKETKGEFHKGEAVPAAPDPFGDPLTDPKPASPVSLPVGPAQPTTVATPLSTEALMLAQREERIRRNDAMLSSASSKDGKAANLKGRDAPVPQRKNIDHVEQVWRALYAEVYPDLKQPAWERSGKERKSIERMIEKYDAATTELALTYAVRQWENLRARRFKGVTLPSIGLLLAAHETVFAEAQQYAVAMKVVTETRAVWEKGGMTATITEHQQALYDRAVKDLKVMGYEV